MPQIIALGLVGLGASSTIAAIGGQLIFTGALVGLSLLLAPDVPKPDDVKIPLKQTIPSRVGILGTTRVSGPYALFYNNHNGGGSFDVILICDCPPDGEVNEWVRLYLHEDVVEIDGSGAVHRLDDKRYNDDRISIWLNDGVNPQTADARIIFSASDVWTSSHRLDGIAYAGLACSAPGMDEFSEVFPFGLPLFSAAVDCRKVPDPRDAGFTWNDRTTWLAASNNNPVLALTYFMSEAIAYGGMGLDYGECFLPVVDDISEEADICDEDVANKGGGTHKRYRCGGSWKYQGTPVDVMVAIVQTADIFIAERGDGAFTIRVGKWRSEDTEIEITDDHIIDIRVDRFREDENEVTGVIVKYSSPDHEYAMVDAPVWPRDAYQGGEDKRVRSTEIVWCQNGRQAQRLSKRIAEYEMAPIRVGLTCTLWALQLQDRRGFTLTTSDDPDLDGVFCRIDRLQIDFERCLVAIEATVIDPTEIDAWDADTEEGPLQGAVSAPIGNEPAAPTDVQVAPELVGGNIRVVVFFAQPVGTDEAFYAVQYRQHDVGGGEPGGWQTQEFEDDAIVETGGIIYLTLNNFAQDEFDFQVRSYDQGRSDWSVIATANTALASPGRPTGFSAVLDGADVDIAWTSPNSSNFYAATVFRALTGTAFALADDISGDEPDTPPGTANTPMTFTDVAPASGTYDYWVIAKNSTGVASSPAGPATVIVP